MRVYLSSGNPFLPVKKYMELFYQKPLLKKASDSKSTDTQFEGSGKNRKYLLFHSNTELFQVNIIEIAYSCTNAII